MEQITTVIKKSSVGFIWLLIKLIINVCLFFWFGWKVGLIGILLSIDIK